MPTKTKGPMDVSAHTSLSPESPENLDLLTLASIEQHPAVQQAIRDKEPMAHRLAEIEEALLSNRKQMAFYAASGQSDPATAATLATAARERLVTLEREHTETIAALRIANAHIAEVTEATRQRLIPELAHVALPEIDARLHGLAVIDAVQRLVGRSTPIRSVRQGFTLERRYLTELRDLLTAADPSS